MYTAQWHEKDPGGATLAEQYESDTQTVEVSSDSICIGCRSICAGTFANLQCFTRLVNIGFLHFLCELAATMIFATSCSVVGESLRYSDCSQGLKRSCTIYSGCNAA